MDRREFLQAAAGVSILGPFWGQEPASAQDTASNAAKPFARVRPSDAGWPSPERWSSLNAAVEGRLVKLDDPLGVCREKPNGTACDAVFKGLRNPYFISDDPALTETSGWVDAWTSRPSAYAVKARTTGDVVAAVNFARENNLRLVIKGGGHSYQGTSNSADSLLIWTREMNEITLHDAFVPVGCDQTQAPQPAVTVETGARWLPVYEAVTTRGGRYVQGGGCTTVGVAGFINGGGFGSFSKRYGQGAAALLEAEIVTADGEVLVINACNHPDLFWAIKGGGGGSFGALTRLTLRTRELPQMVGGAFGRIKATSDRAFRDLISRLTRFYADKLFNPLWGEQMVFEPGNAVQIAMVFQGLEQAEADAIWKPFMASLEASPQDFVVEAPLAIFAAPAQHFWDPAFYAEHNVNLFLHDDRPGAPSGNVFWVGDAGQVGFFLHGYKSAWMPASLLAPAEHEKLVDAVFAATRHWHVGFHFNKGLAGAPAEEIEAARNTAMNPAVLDAFALVIIAGGSPPAFPGLAGREPDLARARADAEAIGKAMGEIRKIAPDTGSYMSEADYFEPDWQRSYWGSNYPRLAEIKKRYDAKGLFFAHNGPGSEEWSADGFTRISAQ